MFQKGMIVLKKEAPELRSLENRVKKEYLFFLDY